MRIPIILTRKLLAPSTSRFLPSVQNTHTNQKPSDPQTINNNGSNRKDIYFKSVLNESGHKNVFVNNYRIATTLTGSRKKRTSLMTEVEATQFVRSLSPSERLIIKDRLVLEEEEEKIKGVNKVVAERPTFKQLATVCIQSGLPFIGFGFVDNFVMIIAGEAIETYIGFYLPISTMAAAGLGNALSDVGGVGLAHHIEYYCSKLIDAPKLTPEQWSLSIVGWCNAISKSLCIFVGCLIGMTPLLFIHHEKKEEPHADKATSTCES